MKIIKLAVKLIIIFLIFFTLTIIYLEPTIVNNNGNATNLKSPTEEFIKNIEDKFFNESLTDFNNGQVTRFKIKNNDCVNLILISNDDQIKVVEQHIVMQPLLYSEIYELFIKNTVYIKILKPTNYYFYIYGTQALRYDGEGGYIPFDSKLAEKIAAIYKYNKNQCNRKALEKKLSLNKEEREIISNLK